MTGQQNYSWIKNNHTIQFGWTFHDEVPRYLVDEGNISGSANFNSMATALESTTSGSTSSPVAVGNTGFDAANFFLGDAATYSVYLTRGVMKIDQKTYALYLQDNWRVERPPDADAGIALGHESGVVGPQPPVKYVRRKKPRHRAGRTVELLHQ